jgi:hypothetical protein
MTKLHANASTGLLHRAAQALGKLFAGMVSLPDDRRHTSRAWNEYPLFPPY